MNRILFILSIFLVAGFFISCSTDTTEPEIGDDAELIQLIKNATNKQTISIEDLLSASKNVLENDYPKEMVEIAKLAPELGYEVDLMRGEGTRVGERSQVYFDLNGRELRDDSGRGRGYSIDRGGEEECFDFVLPVTFIMPDGSTITIEETEDWIEIREWYLANRNVSENPALQYPVTIIFRDGTTLTINSDEELHQAYADCEGSGRYGGGRG